MPALKSSPSISCSPSPTSRFPPICGRRRIALPRRSPASTARIFARLWSGSPTATATIASRRRCALPAMFCCRSACPLSTPPARNPPGSPDRPMRGLRGASCRRSSHCGPNRRFCRSRSWPWRPPGSATPRSLMIATARRATITPHCHSKRIFCRRCRSARSPPTSASPGRRSRWR